MKSFKISLTGLSLGVLLALASPASAAADTWTAFFKIDGVNNGDDGSFTTLIVSSSGGAFTGANANPRGCQATSYAMMSSTLSASAKDLNNKVLLAAYLAGKRVRLRMSGTNCTSAGLSRDLPNGYPTFSIVEVHD
jgi:hypothetical protein